ncbi:hypothetical protein E4634_16150 [Mangrovimicrobium sediminis]|uniref:Uncharacterized protein n=1 Tax=Mangrovimicrobium sediminis TaxID=2562682 RepID=A0A4Z0LYI9_9GAMM|nr:hypothetical protein [Haliea sp. SAOS-164]TGD72198.1 hypothetical protein E4634_16150 [Haliea sp. SAOS-164]
MSEKDLHEEWTDVSDTLDTLKPSLTRRNFIAASLSVPGAALISSSLSESKPDSHDSDLRFHLSEDRTHVRIEIVEIVSDPESNQVFEQILPAPTWNIESSVLGSDARFKLLKHKSSREEPSWDSDPTYRLNVSNCQFGRNGGRSLNFDFFLRTSNAIPRWQLRARTNFLGSSPNSSSQKMGLVVPRVVLDDIVHPIDMREFLNGEDALSARISNTAFRNLLDRTFNGLFEPLSNGKVTARLGPDLVWSIGPDIADSEADQHEPLVSGLHEDIGISLFKFRRMQSGAVNPGDAGGFAGVVGEGTPNLLSDAIRIKDSSGTNTIYRTPDILQNGAIDSQDEQKSAVPTFLARVADSTQPNQPPTLAEAALDARWSLTFQDGSEVTGPFENLRGRLHKSVQVDSDDWDDLQPPCESRLEFRAYALDSQERPIETPAGTMSVEGIALELQVNDKASRSTSRDPFRSIPQATVVQVLSSKEWGLSEPMELDWLEVTYYIKEVAIALENAPYSRLLFNRPEIVFLFNPRLVATPSTNVVNLNRSTRGSAIARLNLNRAEVTASRYTDLLHLKFRFKDLLLEIFEDQPPKIRFANESCGAWSAREISESLDSSDSDPSEGQPEFQVLRKMRDRTEERGTQAQSQTDERIELHDHHNGRGRQKHDTRPLLVVEFPPQHILEEAVFLPRPSSPPDSSSLIAGSGGDPNRYRFIVGSDFSSTNFQIEDFTSDSSIFEENHWAIRLDDRKGIEYVLDQFTEESSRLKFREKLRDEKKKLPDGNTFSEFIRLFETEVDRYPPLGIGRRIPADQKVYIGPYGMDPDTYIVARSVVLKQQRADARRIVTELLGSVLDSAVNLQRLGIGDFESNDLSERLGVESKLESMHPRYQQLRVAFRDFRLDKVHEDLGNSLDIKNVEFFIRDAKSPASNDFIDNHYIPWLTQTQSAKGLMEARISRKSKLVFRINCFDTMSSGRKHASHPTVTQDYSCPFSRETLDFSLDELTNWSSMELEVVSRAENVWQPGRDGRLDAGSGRTLDLSAGAMLDNLGFISGQNVSASTRLADVHSSLSERPGAYETEIVIPARLSLSPADNAVFLTPKPVPDDIYLDHDTVADKSPKSDLLQKCPRPTQLWNARLVCEGVDPGLRAIYSPDLRADFLFGSEKSRTWRAEWPSDKGNNSNGDAGKFRQLPGGAAPVGGSRAPWIMGIEDTNTSHPGPLDIAKRITSNPEPWDSTQLDFCRKLLNSQLEDKVQRKLSPLIYDLCSRMVSWDNWKKKPNTNNQEIYRRIREFRSSLSANDRHQLVLLSSAWGLPVVGRRNLAGGLTNDSSQAEPPSRYRLNDIEPGNALYMPRPLNVSELTMTPLGGSFRHNTGFQPFAGARHIQGDSLFEATSIEQWQHWTVLGRDVFCEVVYKGFLVPTGHRAALVKLTERTFLRDKDEGVVRAYLRQRMFIRCAQPEKRFPALGQPNDGRRFPAGLLKLLTVQTPDIVDPYEGRCENSCVGAGGKVELDSSIGLVFWPRTALIEGNEVQFELSISGVKTKMPMLFVDNVAANDVTTLEKLTEYYNGLRSPDYPTAQDSVDLSKNPRTMPLSGSKIRYCPELESGSASIETDYWTLGIEGGELKVPSKARSISVEDSNAPVFKLENKNFRFESILQGADQPPFYPYIETQRVQLRQNERLTGKRERSVISAFDGHYVAYGLPGAPKTGTLREVTRLYQFATENSINPADRENRQEIFLNFIGQPSTGNDQNPRPGQAILPLSQPKQDMGARQDQSGGIFRPKGSMIALSRKNGVITRSGDFPIWGDDPSQFDPASEITSLAPLYSSKGLPANLYQLSKLQTADILTENRQLLSQHVRVSDIKKEWQKIYKEYFSEGATLFGVVKIRDIIGLLEDTLEDPSTGAPQLLEKVQYGANQAIGEGEDAVDYVRTRVAKPLSDIVKQIVTDWRELDEVIRERQSDLGTLFTPVTIAQVYPELNQGLLELDRSLDAALAENDTVAFAFSLSEVYEAGRRFLDVVLATASDPGSAVEKVLKGRFDTVVEFATDLTGSITTFISHLETAVGNLDIVETVADLLVPEKNETRAYPWLQFPIPYPTFRQTAENPNILIKVMACDVHELIKRVLSGQVSQAAGIDIHYGIQGSEDVYAFFREILEDNIRSVREILTTVDDKLQLEVFKRILDSESNFVQRAIQKSFEKEFAIVEAARTAFVNLQSSAENNSLDQMFSATVELVELFTGPIELEIPKICAPNGLKPLVVSIAQGVYIDPIALSSAGWGEGKELCVVENMTLDAKFAPTDPNDSIGQSLWDAHQSSRKLYDELSVAEIHIRRGLESAKVSTSEIDKIVAGITKANTASLNLGGATARMYCTVYNDTVSLYLAGSSMDKAVTAVISTNDCPTDPNELNEAIRAMSTLVKALDSFVEMRTGLLGCLFDELDYSVSTLRVFFGKNDILKNISEAGLARLLVSSEYLSDLSDPLQKRAAELAANLDKEVEILARLLLSFFKEMTSNFIPITQVFSNALPNLGQLKLPFGINIELLIEIDEALDDVVESLAKLDAKLSQTLALPNVNLKTIENLKVALEESESALDLLSQNMSDSKYGFSGLCKVERDIHGYISYLSDIGRRYIKDFEQDALKALDPYAEKILCLGSDEPLLVSGYEGLRDARTKIVELIAGSAIAGTTLAQRFIDALYPQPRVAKFRDLGSENLDRLERDILYLKHTIENPISLRDNRRYLNAFIGEWANSASNPSTPVLILQELGKVAAQILRGDVLQLLPLNEIREEIEQYLLSLVPTRIEMHYGFGLTLTEKVAKATAGIFEPGHECRFQNDMNINIDMSTGSPELTMSSTGSLGPFQINLIGDFKAVTLFFNGATFTADQNGKPDFDLDYNDYEIGDQLSFVQQIQSFLSPKSGSGFYVTPLSSGPGIEAGYGLDLGVISFGAMSFFNVSLNAATLLFFNGEKARFRAALSRRDAPFTISYTPYGGSGFFAIEATAHGVEAFEASIEFGVAGSFGFGPLTGQGRIMAGIYVRVYTAPVNGRYEKLTEILGTFFAGGSASIWIFSTSASLSVRLGQSGTGDMIGEAVYTFSFSMGIKDFDYSVGVTREEKKPKPRSSQTRSMALFHEQSPDACRTDQCTSRNGPIIQAKVDHSYDDWKSYNEYFDADLDLRGFW